MQISGRYEIPWARLDNDDLTIVLCGIVGGLLIPDRRGHGFPVGWGRVLHDMIVHHRLYAWGPCLLAMLYYQMHGIVYLGYRSISCGVTLLQTWAWEHISISRPVVHVDLQPSEPYAFRYTTGIRHRGSGKTLYWRHQLDIL